MDFFKKTAIGMILGVGLLVLVFAGFSKMENDYKSQIETVHNKTTISIPPRPLASYTPMLIAPYKTMEMFVSEELEADFEFTSVGGTWEEYAPNGTNVETQVRLKVEGKWTQWMDLEEEEDLVQEGKMNEEATRMYAMASSNPATAMQYRYTMYGDGVIVPAVLNPEWSFIKAAKIAKITQAPIPEYSALDVVNKATYLTLNSDSLNVISRFQWGADESYRYMEDNNEEVILVNLDPELTEKFKDELKFSRVVETDAQGNKYKWPLQYPEKVQKFIIHHTASTKNLSDPKQAIRDIYYYHAVSREWGDIGYNYIVDPNGQIYEGRYGGEGVIGAHAGIGNNGSIGIAVLGNYEDNPVPDKAIRAISELIADKGLIHNINPNEYSIFRQEVMPNVFGHRDIMSTTCPGRYLYEKLPVIRSLAEQLQLAAAKTKFTQEYDYIDHSGVYFLDLKPGEIKNINFKLENTGTKNWNSKTFIVVDKNPAFEGVLTFPGNDEVVKASMNESLVRPGDFGTFSLTVRGGEGGHVVDINVSPVINGFAKSIDAIIIPTSIDQANYKYEFIDANYPPQSMERGQYYQAWVKLKNTGNMTWSKNGGNTVLLGTDHSRDRLTQFLEVPSTRIGYLQEDTVPPGETGTFIMNLKAPQEPGYYKEYFTPVVEGKMWMADSGMYFATAVWGDRSAFNAIKALATDLKNNKLQSTAPATTIPTIMPLSSTAPTQGLGDDIRIKLGFTGDPEITGNGSYDVYSGDTFLKTMKANQITKVSRQSNRYKVEMAGTSQLKADKIRFVPKGSTILRIENFEHRPTWNLDLNDNEYRGDLEVRMVGEDLTVINELPLEYYLRGLGEVSNGEEYEKVKAIIVAARTYAKYYMDVDQKFEGMPYNLDDNPDVSQRYLGYGFEKRAPKITKAVNETAGEVLTYAGNLVKTPYFNQSDGTYTKSAKSVWGWTNTPYLISVSDSYCDGNAFLGHGVGMSGCGAKGMAEAGKLYTEILKHYYSGVQITDLY